MECQQKQNSLSCPCTYPGCPRKGVCCECLRHHRENNELPACYFPVAVEKTYDRSVANFLKINS